MSNKLLTIGMSTYDDYDGVYFSVQSLRMYHEVCSTSDVEIVILDNNPKGKHGTEVKNFIVNWAKQKYVPYEGKPSSFNKYKIVEHSDGKYILIIDCHVLLKPNSITALLEYYSKNPDCKDLIQGPLVYDDLKHYSTEFFPQWRDSMYGTWHTNKESFNEGKPFEIKLQGMGLCSFERNNWPGICPHFKGFGAEEGYISEKFRRNGGKNICLPQLGWVHRFGRPEGVKYPLILEDRIWNYFIGWLDITKDPEHEMIKSTYEHFKNKIPPGSIDNLLKKAKEVYSL